MGNLNMHSKYDLSSMGGNHQYHPSGEAGPINGSSQPNANNSSSSSSALMSPHGLGTQRQHPVDLGLQDPSLITPYLLLGGAMVNKNPDLVHYLGITHVVNMAVELVPNMDLVGKRHMTYKHIRSDDSLQYNIRVHFEEAFDIIDDARSSNGRVLVHCMMGISRSATIVIAYLMSRYGMPLRQAYTLVKTRRPEINPNPLFFHLLEEFERELMHSRLLFMNKTAAAMAQRNFDQLADYNQQQHRSMLRHHGSGGNKFFTLKPHSAAAAAAASMYGAGSSSIYNRPQTPVPLASGGSAHHPYSSIIGNNDYRQPYAY